MKSLYSFLSRVNSASNVKLSTSAATNPTENLLKKFILRTAGVVALLLVFGGSVKGQTNPVAFDLSTGSFSFTGFGSTTTSTYPTNMQGWLTSGNNITTAETAAPSADASLLTATAITTAQIGNNGASGYIFQVSQTNATTKKYGSVCVAINTTNRQSINVAWTAQDLSGTAGNNPSAMDLQYRIGTTGTFTTIASTNYTTLAASQAPAQNFSITLPAVCNNNAVVQLRWIYYRPVNVATNDPMRLDEITISSSATPACSGTPSPGNTVASTNPVVSGSSTTLSLQNATSGTGVTYQWQSSTNNSTWTDISGATSATYSATPTAATYYRCNVTCSGVTGTSTSLQVNLTYCTPSGSTTYYINSVTTSGGITNISNTASGASAGGYGNFSSTNSCSNYVGSGTTITITPPSSTYYFFCWVDWNNDFDFLDVNETIFSYTLGYVANYTGTINIPTGTSPGNYRMRVADSWSGSIVSCPASAVSGEYEDYTFTVVALPACAAPTSLAASASTTAQTTTTIAGSFSAASSAPSGYLVVRTTSSTQPAPVTGTTYTAGSNPVGIGYIEYVGASASSWTSTSLSPGTTYYYWVFGYNNTACSGGPVYSSSTTNFSTTTVSCPSTTLAGLSYSSNPVSYCLSSAITSNTATLSSSAGNVTYSVTPALPTGLSINASTGAISGTPTVAVAAANYTVTADNGCSSTTASLNITTLSLPTQPTSSAATSVSTYSFNANWVAASGATAYFLDVATDNAFASMVSGFNGINVGNVLTYSVTGLGAGTTYYYRVRSTNGTCPSVNSSTITVSTLAITSAGSGNWNSGATWSGGQVPTCTDNITIVTGHTVTVNSASNVSKNLTINSGGTLVVASGDLTVGCTLNNTPLTNSGTLTVSGGTLNINGNLTSSSTSVFNQSGGNINIDGNNGGSASGSVASGTPIVSLSQPNTGINLTGGVLTIVDPHTAATNTSAYAFYYSYGTAGTQTSTSNHLTRFGNGISTDAGGNASGFYVNQWVSTAMVAFGSVEINGPSANNRSFGLGYTSVIRGDLTINSNARLDVTSTIRLQGNLVVNAGGVFASTALLSLQEVTANTGTTSTAAPVTVAQSISGLGTFQNASTGSTASLASLTVNNTSASGVTVSTPLSISGTLTMTAGKINTTATNLLTLGTATAAGTLSYTAGQIVGPFARTFAASRSAAGTYDASTLFPVGDGTSYLPCYIDPTTNASGAIVMRGQAFSTNNGSAGTGVSTTLASKRWEALVTSGSSNLTSSFVQFNDAGIATGNIIAQSTSASGTYLPISPTSTVTAATSIKTATAIAAAAYNGYFTYAAPGPLIASFTPGSACPNAATTITITGTNLGSATAVTLNGEACTIVTNSATQIVVTTDATPQAGNIVVTTAANSATSSTALTLFTLPTVTASSNAVSNTICSGTSLTLNGGGAVTYTWNNSVTDNTAFTPTSSATYIVTGTDANGCTNSATIEITVNQIVTITGNPSNQIVLPGETTAFSVTATGTGLAYQWQENAGSGWVNISNGGIYSGASSASLTLTGVTTQDSYQYRVVVSGTAPCGDVTSTAATLTISSTAISVQPQDQTICESSGSASFSVTTTGTTPSYQWQVSTDGGTSWSDISGETNSALSLTGLTVSSNAYKYRCSLNSGSISSNTALLTVYAVPTISAQPSNLTVCSNSTVGSISVTASGNGSTLSYQWQVSTDGGSNWNNVSGSNVSGTTTGTLSFTSFANSMDGYKYKVVLSTGSPCSSVTSDVVTLSVTGITSITPSVATGCANASFNLTASATASSPSLTYSWVCATAGSGATVAITTNPASITPSAAGNYIYTLTATTGSCSLTSTQAITVNAASVAGTATASVSTICVSGSSVLSLSGNTGNIQWQQSSDNSSWQNVASGGTAASYTTSTLTSTTYYRAIVTNSICTSAASNVLTITVNNPQVVSTTPASICASSGTLTLGATASAGSTLNWYAAASGGTALSVGQSFTTPSISNTTTYYVAAAQNGTATGGLGKSIPNTTTTGVSTVSGLVFNLTSDVVLNSVNIYNNSATATRTMTIQLQNSSGVVLYTSSSFSAVGATTVGTTYVTCNLGWNIPAGTGYRLVASAMSGAFVREANPGTFPFALGSFGSITGGIVSGSASTNYLYFYGWNMSSWCESPRSTVVATVSTPPAIIASSAAASICAGQSTTLSVSSPNSGYSYTWNNSAGSGESVSVTPNSTTTYTVTATDNSGGANNGCLITASTSVTVNAVPSTITFTPSSATICNGSIQTLVASGGNLGTVGSINVGTSSTLNGTTSYPAPYTNYYGGAKHQLLIKSSELTALGLVNGSQINSIAFNVSGVGSTFTGTLNNFQIDMGHTTTSVLSSLSFISGLSNVLPAGSISVPTSSLPTTLTHNLTTPFTWNGADNIVIQTSYSNGNSGTSTDYVTMTNSDPGFVSTNWYRADATTAALILSSATPTGSGNARPNMILGVSNQQAITWSPSTDLYTNAAATTAYTGTSTATVYGKPTSTTTYTATATSAAGCTSSNTVQVTVNQPSVAPTSISGTNAICIGSSTTLTAEGGTLGSGANYEWGTGSTVGSNTIVGETSASITVTPSTTTTYWVRITSGTAPCTITTSGVSSAVTVTNPATPVVTVVDNCNNTSTLSTTATGTLAWSTSETTSPITVSTAGTYTVTQTVNGCTSAAGSGVAAPKSTPATPVVSVVNDCGQSTLSFTPAANATIAWSNNATTASTTSTSSATLTVTQTVNGCLSSEGSGSAVPLVIPSAPTATASQNFCVTDNATVGSLAYTSVVGNTYTWYDAASAGSSVATSTQLPTATTTYYLSTTGSNGCTSTTRTAVAATESAQALATVSITGTTVCPGGEIQFTATPVNGGLSPTYQWYNGGVPISGATSETYSATGLAEGAVITVKMIPSGSCVTVCPN